MQSTAHPTDSGHNKDAAKRARSPFPISRRDRSCDRQCLPAIRKTLGFRTKALSPMNSDRILYSRIPTQNRLARYAGHDWRTPAFWEKLSKRLRCCVAVPRQFPPLSANRSRRTSQFRGPFYFEDTVCSAWGGSGRGLLLERAGISTTSVAARVVFGSKLMTSCSSPLVISTV